MKSKLLLTCTILFFCSSFLCGQNQSSKVANSVETNNGCIRHPWQGKRVGYLGDSITDPNCYGDKIKKYWDFLQEWLGITPYVYGISGRQWNDVPRQAEQLKKEHGGEVDAIVILMGTNDFNAVTGLNPMVEEQLIYFYDAGYDRLHPSTKGQIRMARTLMYQLLALPATF